ncbi:MAG: energy transducer TonB [Acidobacteriota bacterium]
MRQHRFRKQVAFIPGRIQRKVQVLGALLILAFAVSRAGFAKCREKPTVWMNERTAASHLITSLKFVFPAGAPVLARIRSVVVIVTVDRTGRICEGKAAAGPMELRRSAEKIVKSSWRYRPFFLDGKRVIVQFPVTVNFVLPAGKRYVKTPELAGVLPGIANPVRWAGSPGAART